MNGHIDELLDNRRRTVRMMEVLYPHAAYTQLARLLFTRNQKTLEGIDRELVKHKVNLKRETAPPAMPDFDTNEAARWEAWVIEQSQLEMDYLYGKIPQARTGAKTDDE